MYSGLSRQLRRTFGRFKDVAYSGCFRHDGKLLVAGGQNGLVQVRQGSPAGCHAMLALLLLHNWSNQEQPHTAASMLAAAGRPPPFHHTLQRLTAQIAATAATAATSCAAGV